MASRAPRSWQRHFAQLAQLHLGLRHGGASLRLGRSLIAVVEHDQLFAALRALPFVHRDARNALGDRGLDRDARRGDHATAVYDRLHEVGARRCDNLDRHTEEQVALGVARRDEREHDDSSPLEEGRTRARSGGVGRHHG